MRCPLRSIAKRPWLKIRLEDRFQNELRCSLDHAVTDGRNREDPHFRPPVLRDFLPTRSRGPIPERDQFVPQLREELVHPRCLDGLERDPVIARGAVVLFGPRVRGAERVQFADVDVQAPEAPRRVSLRLGVYPSLQVLQCNGRRCHLAPASLLSKEGVASRAPSLRGHYSASSLLLAPPTPARRPPISRLRPVMRVSCSAVFTAGRDGSLQLLARP